MTDRLSFDLVSPEKLLLSAEVDMVSVPGVEGDFGVLVNHSPMMSVLRPGVVLVEDGKNNQSFFVRGGFADVTPDGLTILAENALALAGLKKADIDSELADAKSIADAAEGEKKAEAEQVVAQLEALRETL